MLVLALPIPIVVENFAAFYDDQKFQQLLQEKKEAHYAEILHQYDAQNVALEGLIKTITSNVNRNSFHEKSDDEEEDVDGVNENSALLIK